jgi:PAS domain S-box-containing protein
MLDMRTVLLSCLFCDVVCALFLLILWRQNRTRYEGTGYWAADYLMRVGAMSLILLRGKIPDFFSILLASALLFGGFWALLIGLEKFLKARQSPFPNAVFYGFLMGIHTFFTYVSPSLSARNINISLAVTVFCIQYIWVVSPYHLRSQSTTGNSLVAVFTGYCLVSFFRAVNEIGTKSALDDVFQGNSLEVVSLLLYQSLHISLVFCLHQLLNQRLTDDIHEDAKKRLAAEQSARESEERFRVLVETTSEGVWTMDAQHTTTYVNQAMANLLGYPISDMPGKVFEEFLLSEDSSGASHRFPLRPGALDDQYERRFQRQDRTHLWILVTARALMNGQGDYSGSFALCKDITERKRFEEELAANLAVQKKTEQDLSVRLAELQRWQEVMTGYFDRSLILKKEVNELLLRLEEPIRYPSVSASPSPTPIQDFKEHVKANGTVFPADKPDAERGRQALLDALEDRQMAEKRERELQKQLTQVQKMESIGRLAGGVAHDFNNMLGVILGNAEMALNSLEPTDPMREFVKEIVDAANRSSEVTKQLLAFARKQPIAPRLLDLNETLEGMLKMLRRLIGENINLAWLPGKNLPAIIMDPSQIDQILANLCVNARDAISGVGKLTIETSTLAIDEAYCQDHPGAVIGDFVRLTVHDNGHGMDQTTLNHLFEPFFTTKSVGHGTGLGLATVYGIVKQNQGFIQVLSEPGQGSTFHILLPAHKAVNDPSIAAKSPFPFGPLGNETILVVEDEPATLRMTSMMLKRLGYQVLAASTPEQAMAQTRTHSDQIHLLLVDVVMPEMNGKDLAEILLAQAPGIRCLFMSGYTADVIASHGILEEGLHFVQKPFSMRDLAKKVRETLDENPSGFPR